MQKEHQATEMTPLEPESDVWLQIRDLVCNDPVAISKWPRIIDEIVPTLGDVPAMKEMHKNGDAGVSEAVLRSLRAWHAQNRTVEQLVPVLRRHKLSKLAGEVEALRGIYHAGPRDHLVATPTNKHCGIHLWPFLGTLILVAVAVAGVTTKVTTGGFMRFRGPSCPTPPDRPLPSWTKLTIHKPSQMPSGRNCTEKADSLDAEFQLDATDDFSSLKYPPACQGAEEWGDRVTLSGRAPRSTILNILQSVADVATTLRLSNLIIDDYGSTIDCRHGNPLSFQRLTELELNEIKEKSLVCLLGLLASSNLPRLETIQAGKGIEITVQNSCNLRKLISNTVCSLKNLIVEQKPHNDCDAGGIITREMCPGLLQRNREFKANGVGGNHIFQTCE